MTALWRRFAGLTRILTLAVVIALVVAVALTFVRKGDHKTLTADFSMTNSVYEGSDVKMLGVTIGTVDKLTPRGETVRAKISYDADVKLPADAKAVIVSPSIIGDRFVQLAPAYTGGKVMADGAEIPEKRTAVPVELDEVYESLDDLSTVLGPDGANKDGALSDLVSGTSKQLDGQGKQLKKTLHNFGKLSSTLSDNKDNLFGGISEIQEFVAMLKRNDSTVRQFNDSTQELADMLAGERKDLADTLKQLSLALVDIRSLVKENRSVLKDDVDDLRSITDVLAEHQKDLADIVIGAPTALSNVALTYNADSGGTLDTRTDLTKLLGGDLSNPKLLLCSLLGEPGGKDDTCSTLAGLLDDLHVSDLTKLFGDALQDGLPSMPRAPAASRGQAAPENSSSSQERSHQEEPDQKRSSPDKTNSSVAEMLAVNP